MEYKLVKHNNEYWLLDNQMARNIGEFFMERLLTGEWDNYHVDSTNDLVHSGFKVIGSTMTLPNVAKLERGRIEDLTYLEYKCGTEDIKDAMRFMARSMKYIEMDQIGSMEDIITKYLLAIQNEWICEIAMKEAGTVISGGLRAEGEFGGPGLIHHQCYVPDISGGFIKIKTIK